jgi:hypothetical protein
MLTIERETHRQEGWVVDLNIENSTGQSGNTTT